MNDYQKISKIHAAIDGAISELSPGLDGLLCEINALAHKPRGSFTLADFEDLSGASIQLASALHALSKCRSRLRSFQ